MGNRVLIVAVLCMFTSGAYTQDVKSGDMFRIAELNNDNYKHIHFPRPNMVIKKGGLANYANIRGAQIIITEIREKKGKRVATIKLVNQKWFFNSHRYIKVDLDAALDGLELIKV